MPEAAAVPAPEASAAPPADATPTEAQSPPAATDASAPAPDKLEAAAKVVEKERAARRGAAKYRAQLASVQAAQREQAKALEAEKARAAALAAETAALSDPMKRMDYLRSKGITAKELAQEQLNESTPEGVIRRLELQIAQERQQRQAFEQKVAEDARQREAKAQEQAYAAARQEAEGKFIQAAGNAELYPRLAEVNPKIVLAVATATLKEALARQPNTRYTDAEVLAYLNENWTAAKESASNDQAKTAGKTPKAGDPKKADASPTSAQSKKPPQVTNGELPPDFEKLPDHIQRKLLAAQYTHNLAVNEARAKAAKAKAAG